jgi:hypothetical protein
MGWCSGTRVFDVVAEALLSEEPVDKKAILKSIISQLEDMDWDCQQDSDYYEHPLVQEVMREMHPRWFEDEDE